MTTDPTNNLIKQPAWKIKLLYDGECPLCVREVNFLTKKDAGKKNIKFVDITELDYDSEDNANIDYATAMGRIHAILADGTVIKNVEVFRRIYEELGMGWVYAITKLPLIGAIADWLYGIWADWRLKLTKRPELSKIIAEREKKVANFNQGRCRVD
ncbi:MAG: thiol-disulfide oxidoreductase DCC family protein [Waterburya sp.]